ncbi:MAG: cupin domain-containing protein [Actinomycetota bacterium]
MDARRIVVTAVDGDGRSVFADDTEIEALTLAASPGSGFYRLWGWDGPATAPNDGARPDGHTFFPPNQGARWLITVFPPDDAAPGGEIDMEAALAEAEEKMPDTGRWMEPDEPGMHTTETIDFGLVLDGEVELELDDGAKVHLRPGDGVVQNGTRHAWRNPFGRPCTMAFVLIGADRAG